MVGLLSKREGARRSSVMRQRRRKQRQEESIELLITDEGMKYNVSGFCGDGGLYEHDNHAATSLI